MDTREVLARFEAERLGPDRVFAALYPQPSSESALQQRQVQLPRPLPDDLDKTNLPDCRRLAPMWQDWPFVTQRCAAIASDTFRRL